MSDTEWRIQRLRVTMDGYRHAVLKIEHDVEPPCTVCVGLLGRFMAGALLGRFRRIRYAYSNHRNRGGALFQA